MWLPYTTKNQIERIREHAIEVTDLQDKEKLWDCQEVLTVHENLEYVNESIIKLDLVPGIQLGGAE
ncbi:MAG: hypothetical protein JJU13_16565 [Balneolaceae bacterium]|nr:hypothetical protein [Balneolaceae bacterium]